MEKFDKVVAEIKKQAETDLSAGAVTYSYKGDRQQVIEILNQALATEMVCVMRYKAHYEAAKGIHSAAIVNEFKEHAESEQEHADLIANRISQLGGTPNYDPTGMAERSHTVYSVGETLQEMLKEDLIAERIVIGIYQEFIRMIQYDDSTTRIMLEGILKDEEDHADEIASFLYGMSHAEEHADTPYQRKRSTPQLHVQ